MTFREAITAQAIFRGAALPKASSHDKPEEQVARMIRRGRVEADRSSLTAAGCKAVAAFGEREGWHPDTVQTFREQLNREGLMEARGPRPTIYETALDDLKYLLEIAQKHEPGTYRASGTIADLEPILVDHHQRALRTVEEVGLREGDDHFWEALNRAKQGLSVDHIRGWLGAVREDDKLAKAASG